MVIVLQLNTLYTLKLHDVIHQLYLSKAVKKRKWRQYLTLLHRYYDSDNKTEGMKREVLSGWHLLTAPTAVPGICKHLGHVIQ